MRSKASIYEEQLMGEIRETPPRAELSADLRENHFVDLIFRKRKIRSTLSLRTYCLFRNIPVTSERDYLVTPGFPDFLAITEIKEAAVRALRAK